MPVIRHFARRMTVSRSRKLHPNILAELQYHFPMFRACANRLFRAIGAVSLMVVVWIPALSP
ncbi:MAG: hypothetical protein OXE54_01970, partial [Gammaproteobacteria bacterium]|nr:hypothetical protein [Gammaproteobacteria bacterium]